jgi:Eco57I restriction-modification methylase/restriction-modification enzyme MmeI-like protein
MVRMALVSPARHPRIITASQRRGVHIEWLKLIDVSGPFLSVPVLAAEWPDLEPLDGQSRDQLRREHAAWQEYPARNRSSWIDHILDKLLGWQGAVQRDGLDTFVLQMPLHDTTIMPSFALTDPAGGEVKLLGLVSDSSPVARILGSDWPATPADRLAELCRTRKVELGLATDGRWWTLIWAPAGGVTTLAVFDAISWPDSSERDVVRAFVSLLERRRFFAVPPERQLPALLRKSLNNQEEITERLGVQVRQAVELLVAAFARSDLSSGISAHEVYRGAVTVMMRLVFVLFAEESLLLPADNELYAHSYSVGGLYADLEQRVADARGNEGELEHTLLAWHRLLALFTVVYQGVSHEPELKLIAHDGSLFDPTSFAWLPLTVDDRTVLHMLRAVQTVTIGRELRTVSFRTLTVEQIGYVYEGLLSYEGFRAAEIVVGLIGKEGSEAEVSLSVLESLASAASGDQSRLAEVFALKYKDTGIGSAKALAVKLAVLQGDERARAETRLYAVTQDLALTRRLLPFYRIIRQDLRGDPVVILPGALYVTDSALRASSGTHYTPKFLAEQVAEGALEPLVYSPGPLQTADRAMWKLRTPDEILALRVADIAMGSGAFLVAACRYLADKLIEAWSAEGNVSASEHVAAGPTESGLDLDTTASPLVIKARRQIIEHCLYGVDINTMAVEMAKLSLWLVSMDPGRPFTFLDDKLAAGDSLLGITSVEQLEWMHLSETDGRTLHEGTLPYFMSGLRRALGEVAAERRNLVGLPDDNIDDVNKKRRILAELRAKTRELELYADLVSGAALTGGRHHPWEQAANSANEAAVNGKVAEAADEAGRWLATDLPDGGFDRDPLHWPLIFPEVFDSSRVGDSGFDAVIGNPPFLGGKKLTGSLGTAYREYLVDILANATRGHADLIAYFLLRAHQLLNKAGQTGLIATNTLAQGDTREVGLDQIIAAGAEIRQAVKSEPWPSKSAVLEYAAIWTSRAPIASASERFSDGVAVKRVASSLDAETRAQGHPERLAADNGISFIGSYVLGMGFTMEPDRALELIASDSRNAEVLFPYLNGQDLNSRPDCSASRWVINFHDWPMEAARSYRQVFSIIDREVRPERQRRRADGKYVLRNPLPERYWHYADKRPGLVAAIAGLDRVIVITLVSKVAMPVMVPTRQVFAHKLGVFATDDTGMLALLSSAAHYWWAISRSSTMKADLNYSPTDVFETLPLPEITDEMQEVGERLDVLRRGLMLARQAGLTATYNLVHDERCADADIGELREIHRAIDLAVVRSYDWDDLLATGLDHGFHDTRQGPRYTIGPAVRQEILDRLIELNYERYATERAAGLHDKPTRAQKRLASDSFGDLLF